jgi:hypothetical protein
MTSASTAARIGGQEAVRESKGEDCVETRSGSDECCG